MNKGIPINPFASHVGIHYVNFRSIAPLHQPSTVVDTHGLPYIRFDQVDLCA